MDANGLMQPTSLTVAHFLQQAVAHHRKSQLQEAEQLYCAILQIQPQHPDANHNLGVLAVQAKQPAAGLPYFKVALEANPEQGQYWLSYIDALIQADQPDAARQVLVQGRQRGLQGEAVEALASRLKNGLQAANQSSSEQQRITKETSLTKKNAKKLAKLKPTGFARKIVQSRGRGKIPSPQEMNMLVTLYNQERYSEIEPLARAMIERFPTHGFGWKMLGAVFKQLGRGAEALEPMQKAAELSPCDAEAHCNISIILEYLGRLKEAEISYRRALKIKPEYAEAHNNLGNILQKLGRLAEAEVSYRSALQINPEYVEAHYNLGNILNELVRLNEAEASYHQALRIKPDHVDVHCNLGNTLKALGRLSEAEASYCRALGLKSDYTIVHNNLGNTLQELGRLDEAEISYRRALQINPDYVEAHYNLSNTLRELGRLDEAELSYRRALQIVPNFAEAHNNLGTVLKELGRLDEAEASYCRALGIKPDFFDALNNLALLLIFQGEPIRALSIVGQSLQIKETVENKSIFIACVRKIRFSDGASCPSSVRNTLIRALSEPWCRPMDITGIVTNIVKLDPDIDECIKRVAKIWPRRLSVRDLFAPAGFAAVTNNPLLRTLLNATSICDIELERFLTMVRLTLLDDAAGKMPSRIEDENILVFYSLLARQCFINEYVFSHTDDEIQEVSKLRDLVLAALENNAQIPALWVVAVAAYFPLNSLALSFRLLARQWPEAVMAVLIQQVREPEEELKGHITIPRLTSIEDEVSVLVQNQYEENPYPRWIRMEPVRKEKSIDGYLRQRFPLTSFKRLGKSGCIDILIAGCGTGQQSIGTAQLFQGAQVLAVDLSIASLGYAKRKTSELGLSNIEYAQADIMELGSFDRSFDLIESSGVLHHLADPLAGWRVLLSLLRPGGFMKLGFYSEVARRNVVLARAFIAEHGYSSTAEEIRRCRQDLMDLDKNSEFGSILKSGDFFSVSACRDLLFHVQEHRMMLTGIEAFLRDNNLTFLGFGIDADVLRAYKRRFPDDHAATNLGQWQVFEHENPDTFVGMYQFWVQKAGT